MKSMIQQFFFKLQSIFYKKSLGIFFLYFSFFIVFLFPLVHGVGQYWDWATPYFKEHTPNFFLNRSLSWTELGYGQPLQYSTDYFFRFIFSQFDFISPEILFFSFLVILFASGAFGVFLIVNRKSSKVLSFFIGLAAFINPAIFYKLIAGHINYLLAFCIFIYFLYFLLFYFEKSKRSAFITGIFLAFVGVQIQFFIITFLLLVVFLLFRRELFSLKYFLIMMLLPVLINAIWLSNFIFGTVGISELSRSALQSSSFDLRSTEVLNIFNFSFSSRTLIDKFYPAFILSFFSLLFLFLSLYLFYSQKGDKTVIFYLTLFILMVFLCTGIFHTFSFEPVKMFYPIFREVGHFAPVIVLFLFLLFGQIQLEKPKKFLEVTFIGFLFIFLIVNGAIFYNFYPKVDFSKVRNNFENFEKFNTKDSSTYRILFYPFFEQYSFLEAETKTQGNFLQNNSGFDSFLTYSGKEYINNMVTFDNFENSLQYKLLTTYDIDALRLANVKYIYDLSDIYQSNYEKYIPFEVSEKNIKLIKNNKNFLHNIVLNNPDALIKREEDIFEIKNSLPRIVFEENIERDKSAAATSQAQLYFKKINPTQYKIFIKNFSVSQSIYFLETFHEDWKLYLDPIQSFECSKFYNLENVASVKECEVKKRFIVGNEFLYLFKEPIFHNSHKAVSDSAQNWYMDKEFIQNNFSSKYYTLNSDGSVNIQFTLYFYPQSRFLLAFLISSVALMVCLRGVFKKR